MRIFAACALSTLALCACLLARASADNPFDHVVPLVKQGDPLPATRFIDQRGDIVRLPDLKGSAMAIAFVYTRCKDACPIITRKLGEVRSKLGNSSIRLIEVTIDPSHDTPAAIRAYARENHITAPEWLILTGARADVDDFNRRMGVQSIESSDAEILHNERLVLVSPQGIVTDIVEGSSWTQSDLAAQLQHVAGSGGSWLDRADLALGAAVAFCGGALSGRAGIGDLLASLAVFALGIGVFVWIVRKSAASRV